MSKAHIDTKAIFRKRKLQKIKSQWYNLRPVLGCAN